VYETGKLTVLSTKCKSKHRRRHRHSTRNQVQDTHAQRACASTTHTLSEQTRKQVQGTRRQWRLTKSDMQCKHPFTGTERATGPCFCRCHCRVSWLPQLLRIQSSKEDTGQKGQASANKGRTRTRTCKHATSHHKHNTRAPTVTFCFVSLNRYWGINERSWGFFTSEPREYVPTIENRRRTTSP